MEQLSETPIVLLISSYTKIYALGHKYLENLLKGDVIVEEKLDGSQFAFRKVGDELAFRSRGARIFPETVDKLFKAAVDYVISIKDLLVEGWTYRGEVLHAPRHNTLTYSRTPKHCIAIFDIDTNDGQNYLSPKGKELEAAKLDLEVVPCFYTGEITDQNGLASLLKEDSFLGGCKIEGIVVKNYSQFGKDGKTLMGKWVREEFKEIHQGAWKGANPSKGELIDTMVKVYKTTARWDKAIQHLRDAGQLEDAPQDIGKIIVEFQKDLMEECSAEIKEKLFEYAAPKIARGAASGIAEYYKLKLVQKQFEKQGDTNAK